MNPPAPPPKEDASQISELLILSDGTILVHNLTPSCAAMLAELNPNDQPMRQRAELTHEHH